MASRKLVLMAVLVTVFWPAIGSTATLLWNANSEPDLAGYNIYRCSQLPCTKRSPGSALLATVGRTTTSFNIGTPAVVQYYVVTAYDTAGNESGESNVATYTPPTASPPPPPPPEQPPAALAPPPTPGGLRIVTAVSSP
ncbi:MAG TPA: hypothetical protein VNK46_06475 [Nitrospiraceae bacterium]|jgi:hypothetical protein|nr:hypothetical protein [Nitrospiraceae bacterium]